MNLIDTGSLVINLTMTRCYVRKRSTEIRLRLDYPLKPKSIANPLEASPANTVTVCVTKKYHSLIPQGLVPGLIRFMGCKGLHLLHRTRWFLVLIVTKTTNGGHIIVIIRFCSGLICGILTGILVNILCAPVSQI